MPMETLADVIALVKRLFPEVTRDAAIDVPALPSPLALVHRELGGAINRPVMTTLRTRHASRGHTSTGLFLYTQDSLLPLAQLERDDEMLIFAGENQGNWDWRIDEVGAVWSSCRDGNLEELAIVNESLDEFLQGFLLREAIFGSRFVATLNDFDPGDAVPLKADCAVASSDSTFYLLHDHVLVNHEAGEWWFGSNVRDPVDELHLTLP